MAHIISTDSNEVAGTPLTAMSAHTIELLSEEDLKAALILANTQASTKLTLDDVDAALTLVNLSAPSPEKPTTSFHESNESLAAKKDQASASDGQRQARLKYLAAYQRQRRAKLPKDHRKVEHRKYRDKETDAHREERLRKRRERKRVRTAEAKRAQ